MFALVSSVRIVAPFGGSCPYPRFVLCSVFAVKPHLLLSGLAAAGRAGARLVATDDRGVGAYVAEVDVVRLYARHGLIVAEEASRAR